MSSSPPPPLQDQFGFDIQLDGREENSNTAVLAENDAEHSATNPATTTSGQSLASPRRMAMELQRRADDRQDATAAWDRYFIARAVQHLKQQQQQQKEEAATATAATATATSAFASQRLSNAQLVHHVTSQRTRDPQMFKLIWQHGVLPSQRADLWWRWSGAEEKQQQHRRHHQQQRQQQQQPDNGSSGSSGSSSGSSGSGCRYQDLVSQSTADRLRFGYEYGKQSSSSASPSSSSSSSPLIGPLTETQQLLHQYREQIEKDLHRTSQHSAFQGPQVGTSSSFIIY
jgi:hypothetical protein